MPSFQDQVAEYVQKVRKDTELRKEDQFFYRHIKSTISRSQEDRCMPVYVSNTPISLLSQMDTCCTQMDRMPNGYEPLIRFGNK